MWTEKVVRVGEKEAEELPVLSIGVELSLLEILAEDDCEDLRASKISDPKLLFLVKDDLVRERMTEISLSCFLTIGMGRDDDSLTIDWSLPVQESLVGGVAKAKAVFQRACPKIGDSVVAGYEEVIPIPDERWSRL